MPDEQVIAEQIIAQEAEAVIGEEESAETTEEETGDDEVESEETTEEEGEPKKKTAQERIQQLANERREATERADRIEAELNTVRQKAETLEREFRAKQEAQAPDYIEVTEQVIAQVNQRLAQLVDAKNDAELSGNYLQGIAAQKEIDAIYTGLQENASRAEKARAMQQAQSTQNQTIAALDERAEFFRQQNNIPSDVWHEGGNWFAAQCESNAVLGKEFVEVAQYSGPMAAIRFAADYTARNKPKPQAAVQQKEDAKSKLPGGTGKSVASVKTELSDDMPMHEWRKMREKQKYKT